MDKDLTVRRRFNELLYDFCIDDPDMMDILVDSILQSELHPILRDIYFTDLRTPRTSLVSSLYEVSLDGDLGVILRDYAQLQTDVCYYMDLASRLESFEKKYNASAVKIANLKRQNLRLMKRNAELYDELKKQKKNKTPSFQVR